MEKQVLWSETATRLDSWIRNQIEKYTVDSGIVTK